MRRRDFLRTFAAGTAAVAFSGRAHAAERDPLDRPNVIVIFADDQGYQDAGCYGATTFETPNLDRMAAEGVRFTDFYSAAPTCTPSRAALMTGCYPNRVGLPRVLGPNAGTGIHADEMTMADVLKQRDYATACFGKWHLGHHPEFLPTRHGFDEYFGLPYSNDMWPFHPTSDKYPDLPLVDGETVVEMNPDQNNLTRWYTERAVKFIESNRRQPFFLYLPHSMPHVPLHCSDEFRGKSKQGLYGDVIMEIDWSVGQILDTVKRLGLDDNTLVVYSSDNGPWLSYGDHAGAALPLREGKGTTFDGGQREICLMRWPGHIPAESVCSEVAAMFDILPTVAAIAGAPLPDRTIDGKDIRPLMFGEPGARSPHEAFFYHRAGQLEAVRAGKWKLHIPHKYRTVAKPGGGGMPGAYENPTVVLSLFNLEDDIGEQRNMADAHPEVVARLKGLLDAFAKEMAANRRAPGRVGKPA
ncbi:MAG: sulfatase [bacterium]|nr:sulfatase [bacterium]